MLGPGDKEATLGDLTGSDVDLRALTVSQLSQILSKASKNDVVAKGHDDISPHKAHAADAHARTLSVVALWLELTDIAKMQCVSKRWAIELGDVLRDERLWRVRAHHGWRDDDRAKAWWYFLRPWKSTKREYWRTMDASCIEVSASGKTKKSALYQMLMNELTPSMQDMRIGTRLDARQMQTIYEKLLRHDDGNTPAKYQHKLRMVPSASGMGTSFVSMSPSAQLLWPTTPHGGGPSPRDQVEEAIRKDLARTMPDQPLFNTKEGQEKLFNVLRAHAEHDPEVGYCQGMGYIAALCILQAPNEDWRAFWMFARLLQEYDVRSFFSASMGRVELCVYQFQQLLRVFLPELAEYFETQSISPFMFVTDWFMTMFVTALPVATVERVWDLFLVDGWKVLFQVGLAILAQMEDMYKLTQQDGMVTLQYIQAFPKKNPLIFEPALLLRKASYFDALVGPELLSYLEMDYQLQHARQLDAKQGGDGGGTTLNRKQHKHDDAKPRKKGIVDVRQTRKEVASTKPEQPARFQLPPAKSRRWQVGKSSRAVERRNSNPSSPIILRGKPTINRLARIPPPRRRQSSARSDESLSSSLHRGSEMLLPTQLKQPQPAAPEPALHRVLGFFGIKSPVKGSRTPVSSKPSSPKQGKAKPPQEPQELQEPPRRKASQDEIPVEVRGSESSSHSENSEKGSLPRMHPFAPSSPSPLAMLMDSTSSRDSVDSVQWQPRFSDSELS